jgi:hypothetical protein
MIAEKEEGYQPCVATVLSAIKSHCVEFEESLWRASGEPYHERIDPECITALSHASQIFGGRDAVDAVTGTPEWDEVSFTDRTISRPEEGLIVVGYRVNAEKAGTSFTAVCTSVYRHRAHEDWTVVQHAQVAIRPEQAGG